MISRDYLNECFRYAPETGSLYWRKRPRHHFRTERGWRTFNSQKAGKAAGCPSETKWGWYHKVRLDKRLHNAHRLIWILVNGEIPDGMEIDHQDGDGLNNRLDNLRLVTSSGNKKNRALSRGSVSGYPGVYWVERLGGWVAQLWSEGTYYHLGTHTTLESAVAARKAKQVELGFHENHGRSAAS